MKMAEMKIQTGRLGRVAIVVLGTMAVAAGAGESPRNPLIGTWTLVSTVITRPDGTTYADPQVGSNPKGYMIYSDANRMCAQFTNPSRPAWKSVAEPTHEELRSMIDFMGAYCARYEVNVKEGYVLHHVEIDRVPNLSTGTRKRFFKLDGDRLVLSADPPPQGTAGLTITWQRVRE